MATRPQGVQSFVSDNSIADQSIKATPGKLYSVNLSWTGATAGDRVIIHDNTAASGKKLFEFLVPTAVGSFAASIASVGREASVGIFLNFNVAGTWIADVDFD